MTRRDENTTILSYKAFLREDERRRGDALEIGADFTDAAGAPYRVCWYVETGELTIERIDPDALDLEDFHQGVTAVEVAARLDRDELQQRLGDRPHFDRCRPRTIARLRQQLASPS